MKVIVVKNEIETSNIADVECYNIQHCDIDDLKALVRDIVSTWCSDDSEWTPEIIFDEMSCSY